MGLGKTVCGSKLCAVVSWILSLTVLHHFFGVSLRPLKLWQKMFLAKLRGYRDMLRQVACCLAAGLFGVRPGPS